MLETAILIGLGRIANVGPYGVFEFGTYKGATALTLSRNFPHAQICTLDLERDIANELLAGTESNVSRLTGHSMAFDFFPYKNSRVLVFIDGAHDYETVLSDSANAVKMLPEDGTGAIVWHDYDPLLWPGVVRAVDGVSDGGNRVYRVEDTRLAFYLRDGK